MAEEYRCRYCGFKTTTNARLSSHISQSSRCLESIIADNQPTATSHKRHRSPTPGVSGYLEDQSQPNDEFLYSSLLKGQPPMKKARVQDEEDKPFEMDTVPDEFFPPAGESLRARTADESDGFERLQEYQRSSGDQPWAPFSSIEDWDYARWIMGSDLSQRQIDAMLALDLVSQTCAMATTFFTHKIQIKSTSPSFRNSRALLGKIDSLPTGPEWEVVELSVEGKGVNDDGGVVTEKVELWRRDPVECIRELFSNPAFKDNIHYKPQKVYTNESRTERVFSEMWTGEWWWKTQVSSFETRGRKSLNV